jgi:hypothetical protein
MNGAQFDISSAFLILSIVSGAGAASLLVYATARARTRKITCLDVGVPIQLYDEDRSTRQGPSSFEEATLPHRNLTQCPNCFMIDQAGARFCIRCGIPMQSQIEHPVGNIGHVESQFSMQEGSSRVLGFSTWLDPETRLGVIIGIQKREPLQSINETRN